HEVLKDAAICIANTRTEAQTIYRDCPKANVKVVHWAPGFGEEFLQQPVTDEFLRFTGLQSGEYILQVGRMQMRKNQLGSILATKDLDIPLVFITTSTGPKYIETCLAAIKKWRKGPTFIIGQDLPEEQLGPHRLIPMPNRQKLSTSMLHSAFGHAGLHLHPAFYELPGATYFESLICGVPTIASTWTTVSKTPLHPALTRTNIDVAREILEGVALGSNASIL
ncbi:MAG: hypothetical protein HY069_04180, partial [Chlamydiia bacterium]|nr:hypothetical protein [Chlamydiia bacterium]